MRNPLRRVTTTLAIALFVAGPSLAATVHTAQSPALALAASSAPTCGGTHIAKSTGGYWTCTFDDEFGQWGLDRTKWTVMTTATTGYYTGDSCYLDSSKNLQQISGSLRLIATKPSSPVLCGARTATYLTSAVNTSASFAQEYGRFEMRARFPAGVGLQPAFWLYPQNMLATGTLNWGEMDVVEAYGAYPGIVSPHLHYVLPDSTPTAPGTNCYIASDTTSFHTYAMEWTSTTITFKFDGATCWSVPKPDAGYPLISPAPFDQKYFVIVELALGGVAPNLPASTTPFPATMTIDYVRAWT